MKRCSILTGLAVAFALAVAPSLSAAEAQIGEPAPQFTLTDVQSGDKVSLSDYKDDVVVLVWHSIHCPWNFMRDEAGYERVLKPFAKQWQQRGVTFLAINSNHNEPLSDVKEYAQKHQLGYPILHDPGNAVADQYDAKTTPHFYVISKGDQRLLYQGGFEQAPVSPRDCGEMDEQYLAPVLEAAVAGETVPYTKTPSKGCTVKRK
jgi:peroxiredoxin